MSSFQLPTINFSGIQVRFRLWRGDSQRWRGDGEWRRWLGINLGNFPQFFCPPCWRLIQSVEIPRAWLIEILIVHHHHCEIGHNIKLLWHCFMASWISEQILWRRIAEEERSTWAAKPLVAQRIVRETHVLPLRNESPSLARSTRTQRHGRRTDTTRMEKLQW